MELISTIQLPEDSRIECIAVNEKTNKVYVGVETADSFGELFIIDGYTKQISESFNISYLTEEFVEATGSISGGTSAVPRWMKVDSLNNLVFLSLGYTVYIFDCNTNKIITRTYAGDSYSDYYNSFAIDYKRQIFYEGEGTNIQGKKDKIWVRTYGNSTLSDTSIDIPNSQTPTTIQRVRVAVDVQANHVYALWSYNRTLFLIDGETYEILNWTNLPEGSGQVYVFNHSSNKIFVHGAGLFDGVNLNYISDLEISEILADDPEESIIYATKSRSSAYGIYDCQIQVIETSDNTVIATSYVITSIDEAVNTESKEVYFGFGNELSVFELNMNDIPEFPVLTIFLMATLISSIISVVHNKKLVAKTG